MTKNNYTISQEYLIRLENECLIEKIVKLEKELGQKELDIKMLKKNLQFIHNITKISYETKI
jgi:predicted RNase H-like nuclease (RuvC/YqgF family)